MPRKGLAAFVLTAAMTLLLFSFKTPEEMFGAPASTGSVETTAQAQATLQPNGAASNHGDSNARPAATPPPTANNQASNTNGQASNTNKQDTSAKTPAPTPAPTPAAQPAAQVVKGQVVRTPYGPVQVQITLDGTSIADISALQLPYDRSYSRRISSVVEPMLRQEALRAQSAHINLISGATYTSEGYAMSLQSALDQAA